MHWRRKWQPTPVFLPGESQGWGSLVGCHLWGRTESDTTGVTQQQDFPSGSAIKSPPANVGDLGSIPGSGRSPGEWNDNPLQYSCLGSPMDRRAWRATIHGGHRRVSYDSVTDKENELPGYCTDIDWNILPRFPGRKSFLLVLGIQPEGPARG